jgi:protocatechuate 3,4-dioxygenase beta subunit
MRFRDDSDTHPPMDYPGYKSTALRHPKHGLIPIAQRLTEVTAPVFGDEFVKPDDNDLTKGHEGEPIGQRIIVHGHVKEDDGMRSVCGRAKRGRISWRDH